MEKKKKKTRFSHEFEGDAEMTNWNEKMGIEIRIAHVLLRSSDSNCTCTTLAHAQKSYPVRWCEESAYNVRAFMAKRASILQSH